MRSGWSGCSMRRPRRCGAISPRPSCAAHGSWAGPTPPPVESSSLSSIMTICRTTRCPYPESHAAFKGATWSEKVLRFDPPRLARDHLPGRQERHRDLRIASRARRHAPDPDPQRHRQPGRRAGFRQRLELAFDRASRAAGRARRARTSGRFTPSRARRSSRLWRAKRDGACNRQPGRVAEANGSSCSTSRKR